jgi:hypothetical protein
MIVNGWWMGAKGPKKTEAKSSQRWRQQTVKFEFEFELMTAPW